MNFAGLDLENAVIDPDDAFYIDFLRDYYIVTADGQYLFATRKSGRNPDRVFYAIPNGYRLGKNQRFFNNNKGKVICEIAFRYLQSGIPVIGLSGIQGERRFETGLDFVVSAVVPHSAHLAWMGKQMVFPSKGSIIPRVFNYAIPEGLPPDLRAEIKSFYPEYEEPLVLFDLTGIKNDVRRVLTIGSDYFGEVFKKPNLTMVWNRAEANGFVSYHAGCTEDRVLKGLSGTGKTTLSVGDRVEQDDAVIGIPIERNGRISEVELVGLEAASFAKSEGLNENSPEWRGLMRSREPINGVRPIVLAMNIDCENIDFITRVVKGHEVKVPAGNGGHLICTSYEKSGTRNGRFIFRFSELNRNWGKNREILKSEGLTFKRFDIVEPLIRAITPDMAVALDSACESVVTSAVSGKREGSRIRSYAATDFMAREASSQALLKLRIYEDLGLGFDGKLLFFVINTGWIGNHDVNGNPTGKGEKITVDDSKNLLHLVENRLIKRWIVNPVFGYLIPDPIELEEEHGMEGFCERFNPMKYYSEEEILRISKRDLKERTEHLRWIFHGEEGSEKLKGVTSMWDRKLPDAREVREFYVRNYR